MNFASTGKAISSLRKQAGFTQASLAEALEVSDKAVSKWERGLACPDISLLPKLSILLDTDIEGLFSGDATSRGKRWNGILFLDDYAATHVNSRPLVHLLLQNFLLVGIRKILVIGGNVDTILGSGERYGVQFKYSNKTFAESLSQNYEFTSTDTMIVFGKTLIYGANLTRKYQAMMFQVHDAVIMKSSMGDRLPIAFCPQKCWEKVRGRIQYWEDMDDLIADIKPIEKSFARGIITLQMNDKDQIVTASHFIRIVEQSDGREIANLEEIAKSRGLIRSI